MRIVCISDTHQMHKDLDIPHGDLLLHAGDFTNSGHSKPLKKFNAWLGRLPHKHKVIIAGNHDKMFQNEPERARRFITNATYLEDSSTLIPYGDGHIKIYGAPWSTEFYPRTWSFNASRGPVMQSHWTKIPEDTDILMTHGPSFGYGDRVNNVQMTDEMNNASFEFLNNGRSGCKDLEAAILRIKPRLHLCGHIHEDRGEWRTEHTTYVNASSWNHFTNEMREPIVFDWDVDL